MDVEEVKSEQSTATYTIPDLLSFLDESSEPIPMDVLDNELRRIEPDLDWLSKYFRFGEKSYKRNLIHEGAVYHALAICWRPGQRSPIHDHHGSACGVRVIKGCATETVFQRTDQ